MNAPMPMPLVARLVKQTVAWVVAMGVILFAAAGTFAWGNAWSFLLLSGVFGLWVGLWLARHDPGLLAERLAPPVQSGQSRWDRFFMAAVLIMMAVWLVLMAFDARRFHWSAMLPLAGSIGALCLLACFELCRRVFRENSFAAPVVKVQRERGHKVIDSGPYARVRHPMYSAALLYFIGVPLMLGSWWGLACFPLLAIGLARRAVHEESVLTAELDGYAGYTQRVRFRFVPGVW